MEKPPKPVAAIPPFGLRMQPALKASLEESAKRNARSLNQEIVTRLEQSLVERPVQSDQTTYVFSAIERLEGLLTATEGKYDALAMKTLMIAAALAEAYPFARSAIESGEADDHIRNVLETGAKSAREFCDSYTPQGMEKSTQTISKLQRTLGKAYEHLSVEQSDLASRLFDSEANEAIMRAEQNTINRIKSILGEHQSAEPISDRVTLIKVYGEQSARGRSGSRQGPANPISDPTAFTKSLAAVVESVGKPRTPSIPGANAPKGGTKSPKKRTP